MTLAEALAPATSWVDARTTLEDVVRRFPGARTPILLDCPPELAVTRAEAEALALVTREAVDNALRHAFPDGRDGRIWVSLKSTPGRLTLAVRDNGIGIPDLSPDPASGHGRIAAAAEALGGQARLGSELFGGALVTLVLRRPAI